jgi:glycosyltransferase involved in cell wall biosynthesis
MRVLVGMPDKDSLGGTIYCEPPFVDALRSAGVDVDEEVYVYGEKLAHTSTWTRITRVINAARRLRRRTLEKRYDLIHLNTSFDEKCVLRDLVTLFFLRLSGVPVFLKIHGSMAPFLATRSLSWRFLQHRVFSGAAGLGILSTEEMRNFLGAGCPPEKLFRVKNIVSAGEFHKDASFRERHGLAPDTEILLFSSRFVPNKGLLSVIAACAEVKKTGRRIALFCLGDGPVRDEAEQLARSLGLEHEVRFFGYIPEADTPDFHANSTVFVFPSDHEGLSIVLLKSLAAGLPIITTRVGAAADFLAEPENCLWVEPRAPQDLAAKIIRLLDDPELRTAMSLNNRSLARQFTADRVVAEYLTIYRNLTGA